MAKTFQDIMADARKEIPELTAQQVNDLLTNNGKSHVVLDVREKDEWREGHLEGAVPTAGSRNQGEAPFGQKHSIIAYCAGGVRSLIAGKALKKWAIKMSLRWLEAMGRGRTPVINGYRIFSIPRSNWYAIAVIFLSPK
jgi:rhodanese-related sulfurtransferase